MRKFLGIRSIGRPIVNACLTVSSLLLMVSGAEAMPQKASDQQVLNSLFPTSSQWAVPSTSCATRAACIADTNFQTEFTNFVNFIQTRYPTAKAPLLRGYNDMPAIRLQLQA